MPKIDTWLKNLVIPILKENNIKVSTKDIIVEVYKNSSIKEIVDMKIDCTQLSLKEILQINKLELQDMAKIIVSETTMHIKNTMIDFTLKIKFKFSDDKIIESIF